MELSIHQIHFELEKKIFHGLRIVLRIRDLLNLSNNHHIPMECDREDKIWTAFFKVNPNEGSDLFVYEYLICDWHNWAEQCTQADPFLKRSFTRKDLLGNALYIRDNPEEDEENPNRLEFLNPKKYVLWRVIVRKKLPFGQSLYALGILPQLGSGLQHKSMRMLWTEGDYWRGSIWIPFDKLKELHGVVTVTVLKSFYYRCITSTYDKLGKTSYENKEFTIQ